MAAWIFLYLTFLPLHYRARSDRKGCTGGKTDSHLSCPWKPQGYGKWLPGTQKKPQQTLRTTQCLFPEQPTLCNIGLIFKMTPEKLKSKQVYAGLHSTLNLQYSPVMVISQPSSITCNGRLCLSHHAMLLREKDLGALSVGPFLGRHWNDISAVSSGTWKVRDQDFESL